jgi:hypothetical protein
LCCDPQEVSPGDDTAFDQLLQAAASADGERDFLRTQIFAAGVLACAVTACGARTEVEAAMSADASVPVEESCWTGPLCIEAEIAINAELPFFFAEPGEPVQRSRFVDLTARNASNEIGIHVQLGRSAAPADYQLERDLGNQYFVDIYLPLTHHVLGGVGRLGPVALTPNGVTEGTFEGHALDLDPGQRIVLRRGRFRLTLPP